MIRLSSKITLLLKIMLPGMWAFFFGLFWIAAMTTTTNNLFDNPTFLVCFTVFYFGFLLLFYFTLFRLMRVESDAKSLFISNFKNTYKYSFKSFESIYETRFLMINIVTLRLKETGSLGRNIHFVSDRKNYTAFINQNPQLLAHLLH